MIEAGKQRQLPGKAMPPTTQQFPTGLSLGEVYREHSQALLDYVHRRTGDVHVTEDLVADVFVDVAAALPKFRDRGIPIRFWLLRIAGNAVNRWMQRSRPWAELEADSIDHRTESPTEEADRDGHLQRAFLSLPPRYQDVLSLHHMEGYSTRETAAILGCREGTVRSRLTRARAKLRRKLEQVGWSAGGTMHQ